MYSISVITMFVCTLSMMAEAQVTPVAEPAQKSNAAPATSSPQVENNIEVLKSLKKNIDSKKSVPEKLVTVDSFISDNFTKLQDFPLKTLESLYVFRSKMCGQNMQLCLFEGYMKQEMCRAGANLPGGDITGKIWVQTIPHISNEKDMQLFVSELGKCEGKISARRLILMERAIGYALSKKWASVMTTLKSVLGRVQWDVEQVTAVMEWSAQQINDSKNLLVPFHRSLAQALYAVPLEVYTRVLSSVRLSWLSAASRQVEWGDGEDYVKFVTKVGFFGAAEVDIHFSTIARAACSYWKKTKQQSLCRAQIVKIKDGALKTLEESSVARSEGNYGGARQMIQALKNLTPEQRPWATVGLATLSRDLGEYDKALAEINQALQQMPTEATSWGKSLRSMILLELNKTNEALEGFRSVDAELRTRNIAGVDEAQMWALLGVLYIEVKNQKESRNDTLAKIKSNAAGIRGFSSFVEMADVIVRSARGENTGPIEENLSRQMGEKHPDVRRIRAWAEQLRPKPAAN